MEITIKRILYLIKDILHVLFVILMGFLAFNAIIPVKLIGQASVEEICSSIGINEIFTFIGAIGFLLFGIIGVYEFAYLNGVDWLAHSSYVKCKDRNNVKQAQKMMELYYKKDIAYIQEYEKERTEFLLQAIGIQEKQFKYINYEIIKARLMTDRSIFDLKRKARKTLLHKQFIVDQSTLKCSKRVYDRVDYFMNLYAALYDEELCKAVASIMSRYLVLSLGKRIEEIDYIIIPEGSNFLLGLEVGKQLDKKIISVLPKERIYKDVFWDGDYDDKKHNNIVAIHDVLVSGERIYKSINKLPEGTYNLEGIFCLFQYKHKDFTPIKDFEKNGISKNKVNCLLDIDEDMLKTIYDEKYEMDE